MVKLEVLAGVAFISAVGFAQESPSVVLARKTKVARCADTPTYELGLIVVTKTALPLGYMGEQRFVSDPTWRWIPTASSGQREELAANLRANKSIAFVFRIPQGSIRPDFSANDTYYPKDVPSAGYRGQWHLKNTIEAGVDINVEGAWADGWTGAGVSMANIDDGLQTGHEDLFPNYVSANSYDFASGDAIPNPVTTAENHGTATAGIMAARGGNSLGVTGVSPEGALSSIRVGFSATNIATQLADALLFKSSGADTSIKIKNQSYGTSSPFLDYSALSTAITTSAAAGTIHVQSAGNYRGTIGEDSNKHSDRANPAEIVVAALGNNGVFADYSNFGSNLMCTVPSSPTAGSGIGILTTDRSGSLGYNGFPNQSYSHTFGGTSAAAPQVAGALGLAKQVRPNLTSRFAKHLLARTCRQVDASDASAVGGWTTNAAGLKFNPNYGFGLLDATALVNEAKVWGNISPATEYSGTGTVATAIPDGTSLLSRTFTVATADAREKVEDVVITITATHGWRGDLEGKLISPSGTVTRFLTDHGGDSGDNLNWSFTVNALWNEDPDGTWTIQIRDLNSGDAGTWDSFGYKVRTGWLEPAARTLSGSVDLLDFANDPGQSVAYELRQGATVAQSGNLTLGTGGAFSLSTSLSGVHDLWIKGRHWLAKKQSVNASTDQSGLTYLLPNGDVNGDNLVDIADYTYLATAFDLDSSAANWLTPDGSGIMPADSDLNGDGIVDIADYTILATAFDQVGD